MELKVDDEGFLLDRDDWSKDVAAQLAHNDGYEMTSEIMGFIHQAQSMYNENGVVPPIRKFAKQVGTDSKHLYNVFKKGPMKLICKWGALPKPTGCV